jgi:hypothetical protein
MSSYGLDPIRYLTSLSSPFIEAEKVAKYERDATAYKCDLFYGGQQQLFQDDDGWWYPIEDGEIYWTINLFAYHVRANAKEFTRSHPELLFRAMGESFRSETAARGATNWWKQVEARYLTETFLQREGKRLQLHGGAWRLVTWDAMAGRARREPRLQTGTEQLAGEGYLCQTCQGSGPYDPSQGVECPECDSPNIDILPAAEIQSLREDGTVEIHAGDLHIEQPDGYEMWTQSTARILDEALWVRRHRRVDRASAEAAHPGRKLKPFVQNSVLDRGPAYQRRAERTYGGADKGAETVMDAATRREVEYTEDWYQPEVYLSYVYEGADPVELPDGQVMQPGQTFVELYPTGMKVTVSGEELLDCREENFREHFEYIPYDILPGRFWGKGVEDAVPIQENYNETVSLIFTNMMNCDTPVTVYDQSAIKSPGIPGSPSRLIPVGERPPGLAIRDVYQTFPGSPLPAEVWNFLQLLKEDMQLVFGAFSTFTGAPDVNVDTATGMALLDENAKSLVGMPLALRAEAEARFAKKCLKLFVANATEDRFVSGDYSQIEARYLKGADVDVDLQITVKPGSYMPRQEHQRRNDLMEFATAIQTVLGPGAAPLATPAFLLEMATRWNVPTDVLDPILSERAAQRVLEEFRELAAQWDAEQRDPTILPEMKVPPEVAAEVIKVAAPVNLWTDNHLQMASWFRAYANTDEGLNDSLLMKQLINDRIQEHIMYESQRLAMTQALSAQGAMMGMMGAGAPPPVPGEGGGENPEGDLPAAEPPAQGASPVGDIPMPNAQSMVAKLPLLANRPSDGAPGLG